MVRSRAYKPTTAPTHPPTQPTHPLSASAGLARGSIFTNHCSLTRGSTISPPRWERGTRICSGRQRWEGRQTRRKGQQVRSGQSGQLPQSSCALSGKQVQRARTHTHAQASPGRHLVWLLLDDQPLRLHVCPQLLARCSKEMGTTGTVASISSAVAARRLDGGSEALEAAQQAAREAGCLFARPHHTNTHAHVPAHPTARPPAWPPTPGAPAKRSRPA